ncbi:MAG: zinc ribbon domain-containing protein [Clostridia bacterium]|nr:zinc ribbon domain-containing protein [Clostridia bacterium]
MFCKNCGNEIDDKAVICTICGCMTDEGSVIVQSKTVKTVSNGKSNGFITAIKVLSIITCVFSGFMIFPLAWMIPMTVSLFGKLNRNEYISTGFKVCYLLFCNLIAGVLLLVLED